MEFRSINDWINDFEHRRFFFYPATESLFEQIRVEFEAEFFT